MRTLIFGGLIFLLSVPAYAQSEVDSISMQQTKEMLTNPSLRQEALPGDPAAQAAAAKALAAVKNDPQKLQEMFAISSDVFSDLLDKTPEGEAGDAAREKIMSDAQKDPQAFFRTLSPAQRARIEALAAQK